MKALNKLIIFLFFFICSFFFYFSVKADTMCYPNYVYLYPYVPDLPFTSFQTNDYYESVNAGVFATLDFENYAFSNKRLDYIEKWIGFYPLEEGLQTPKVKGWLCQDFFCLVKICPTDRIDIPELTEEWPDEHYEWESVKLHFTDPDCAIGKNIKAVYFELTGDDNTSMRILVPPAVASMADYNTHNEFEMCLLYDEEHENYCADNNLIDYNEVSGQMEICEKAEDDDLDLYSLNIVSPTTMYYPYFFLDATSSPYTFKFNYRLSPQAVFEDLEIYITGTGGQVGTNEWGLSLPYCQNDLENLDPDRTYVFESPEKPAFYPDHIPCFNVIEKNILFTPPLEYAANYTIQLRDKNTEEVKTELQIVIADKNNTEQFKVLTGSTLEDCGFWCNIGRVLFVPSDSTIALYRDNLVPRLQQTLPFNYYYEAKEILLDNTSDITTDETQLAININIPDYGTTTIPILDSTNPQVIDFVDRIRPFIVYALYILFAVYIIHRIIDFEL